MLRFRAAIAIVSTGLVTFLIVFTLLQVTRSEAAPGQVALAPTPRSLSSTRAVDSLTRKIAGGAIAVGVPIGGSELLLRDVQVGDRLDVLASLRSPGNGRPVTAVVVSGATVLEPATARNPLVLEVSATDSMALAHLVLSGTRLGYIVWPANGGAPPHTQSLDERTAQSVLGLAPTVSQVEAQATPNASATATPRPAPTLVPTVAAAPASPVSAVPRSGGFLYQVQPGDSWESIAGLFGLSASELKHWNETSADQDLDPRTLLFIPRS